MSDFMGPGAVQVSTLPGQNEHGPLSLIPLVGSGALKILCLLIRASPSSPSASRDTRSHLCPCPSLPWLSGSALSNQAGSLLAEGPALVTILSFLCPPF